MRKRKKRELKKTRSGRFRKRRGESQSFWVRDADQESKTRMRNALRTGPRQAVEKDNEDGFASPLPHLENFQKTPEPIPPASEINFKLNLTNKFNTLINSDPQTLPVTETSDTHAVNNNRKTNPNATNTTANLPPVMLKTTNNLREQMKTLTSKMPFLCIKMSGNYIKLYTDNSEQRLQLIQNLEKLKFQFYKITPKTERRIKVVIKGLPRHTKTEDIRNDLIDLGFSVDRFTQLIGNITKQLLPVFSVTLPRNLNNAKILELNRLSYLSITVEGFESKGAIQCFQCNNFNHTADNCHMTPRCLKSIPPR
ncbi:nucleic-acid-binding protein from transposon X-element [Trichonephila clavipes]|nr:nucleic-acid-binding protein from transposon X-element [Trichonephila clavipes]